MAATKKKTNKPRTKVRRATATGCSLGPTPMRVELTRIRRYDRDPRRSQNPEYDRIKSSILMAGMDQPLLITQRPGQPDYIVRAGGNTRLQILEELYESTGDQRFFWADCLFEEWTCESAVLLAHLRENELRGNLTFIDRAQAVMEVKALIAGESGRSDISQRELETTLKDQGYSVSHGLISLMGYAHSTLLPLLPIALDAGLGKHQIRRIRQLEGVGREVWKLRQAGPATEFKEVFATLCRRYDGEEWQLEPLRRAIEVEIAEAADVGIQVVRMEFDCRLAGQTPEIPDFAVEEPVDVGEFPVSRRDEPALISEAERRAEAAEKSPAVGAVERVPIDSSAEGVEGGAQISVELPLDSSEEALLRHIGGKPKDRLPLELLRETAFELAQRLAGRYGMTEIVKPLPDNGLGFLVSDVPPADIVACLDDDLKNQVLTMWWQLVAFAEVVVAPKHAVSTRINPASALGLTVDTGDPDGLIDALPAAHLGHVAHRFYRNLTHEDWCDWLYLAHNYRELHRTAKRLNTSLWSQSA